MELGIAGRHALVCAASKGLGAACAAELAAEGARVTICGRNRERLEQTAESIRKSTAAEVLAVPADLTEEFDRDNLLQTARQRFGPIELLVLNGGGPAPGMAADFSAEDYAEAVQQLLVSNVDLALKCLPYMRSARYGRIVAITSIAVRQPVLNLALSNTGRAGLTGFLKSLSTQVAAEGITVNAVCPGVIFTDRIRALAGLAADAKAQDVPAETMRALVGDAPIGRMGAPAELAALVAFLCSERASFITGVSIPVDGGAYKGLL